MAGGGLLRAVMPRHPVRCGQPGIDTDLGEGRAEDALEIIHSAIVGAELFLEGNPGDEGRPAGVDAMKALRQPGEEVQRHSAVSQRRQVRLGQRYGVMLRLSQYSSER